MNQSFWRLILLAFLAVILMAIVPVIIKYIQVDPWLIGASRLLIAVIGLSLLALAFKRPLIASVKQWPVLVLLGVVFACHWLTYFYSIHYATASIAAIGVSTFGAHLLLLGWWVHKKPPHWIEIICVLLAFFGVYLVLPELDLRQDMTIGFLLSILSGFLYALLPIIHQKNNHIKSEQRIFGQFFFALVLFSVGLPSSNLQLNPDSLLGLIVLGVVSTLIAHSLWVKVSTELPHTVTSIIYYLYVPLALILSYFFLNEELSVTKTTGAAIIVGANIIGISYRAHLQSRANQLTP